ncbi:hypothetical protein GCM10011579_001400 [Streptomyces albiflavescens]|uniref:Pyridoxamine 5'-phosphate oxidase n=1 Tax=Streptomyces albiflavescens TaxID=1623582 RepID=A0A917XRX5_9ACTN|nr:pyridoxamine 5'-phosphate oxidase family protein [Streptomyces albiflavescens]GGN48604.1 hypothetical protein GCM10011579_001400 [Streptomyces albiflavescens]
MAATLPGAGQAARHAELIEPSTEECRVRFLGHGIGRLAIDTPEGPFVAATPSSTVRSPLGRHPIRTTAVGADVAYEVDHIDEALSQRWSVLIRGRAWAVTDPDIVHRLQALAYSGPRAGGERGMWVSLDPRSITGRRIAVR